MLAKRSALKLNNARATTCRPLPRRAARSRSAARGHTIVWTRTPFPTHTPNPRARFTHPNSVPTRVHATFCRASPPRKARTGSTASATPCERASPVKRACAARVLVDSFSYRTRGIPADRFGALHYLTATVEEIGGWSVTHFEKRRFLARKCTASACLKGFLARIPRMS